MGQKTRESVGAAFIHVYYMITQNAPAQLQFSVFKDRDNLHKNRTAICIVIINS